MSAAVTTTDHEEIRKWAEARGGRPARVKVTRPGGILRIDFGEPEEELEPITWADFFRIFDENNLAFLYQERTDDDRISRFNKLVERD
ncbi:hypothetical protein [Chelativorans salis]|uniref:1,4-alpha-glucan branching enzyme n=1 Tax=Chelativorans salis TaxID=2978478 RepID=A0ABT2LSA2_9HYPH|nr:hypothetical protein [Chelativorans sp. EGI FJ00035]MCT7377411.1 hypothetical protein [Chelativorans sp. EGI FJ00035]